MESTKPRAHHQSLQNYLLQVQRIIDAQTANAWVSAEIAEAKEHQGHLYLSLVDHDEKGQRTASCRAMIWRNQLRALQEKFTNVTGTALRADLKVLINVTARFAPRYGFSLTINDVDPAYTLGDVARRIAAIRLALITAGRYEEQKQLRAPLDFCRVAVLSPDKAAGLGDFRREADLLSAAGLTQFDYFQACFQGPGTTQSVVAALREIFQKNRQFHYDCIVIIRGGGAITDLNYLNELEIAQAITHFPTPVLTGIGHQKDQTILDEVAFRSFDTPSKVISHIKHCIHHNAQQALQHLNIISACATQCLHHWAHPLALASQTVKNSPGLILNTLDFKTQQSFSDIENLAKLSCIRVHQTLEDAFQQSVRHSERVIQKLEMLHTKLYRELYQRSALAIDQTQQVITQNHQRVENDAHHVLETTLMRIDHVVAQSPYQVNRMLEQAQERISHHTQHIQNCGAHMIHRTVQAIAHHYQIAALSSPEHTLNRGFSLLRDDQGKPIKDIQTAKDSQASSQQAAAQEPQVIQQSQAACSNQNAFTHTLQFRDGSVPITLWLNDSTDKIEAVRPENKAVQNKAAKNSDDTLTQTRSQTSEAGVLHE